MDGVVQDGNKYGPVSAIATGAAVAVGDMATTVSLAALVFTGPLAFGLQRTAAGFVFASGLLAVLIALGTRMRTSLSGAQDLGAIVLLGTLSTVASPDVANPVATMLAVLVITSMAFGATVLLLARLHLSAVVRFLPTTVIMGFVAGTGWLLMRGGLEVALDRSIGWADLPSIATDDIVRWLPGLILAVGVVLAAGGSRLPAYSLGILLAGSTALFYAVVATISSVSEVGDQGWLIGPFTDMNGWRPVMPSDLRAADWSAVGSLALTMAAIVFVSTIGMLLNLKSTQSASGEGVDFGHEMSTTGIANIVAAPAGGLIGFHSLGDTALAMRVGIEGRRIPVAVGLTTMAVAVVAGEYIGYVPRFLVGGMLGGLGLLLFGGWLAEMRARRNVESFVSAVILGVVIWAGMFTGIGVGIAAASLIFLVRYSRVDPIRLERSGVGFPSSVERSAGEMEALAAEPDAIRIFQVQGYLFFGSIETLHDRVAAVFDTPGLRSVIVDFRHVTGLDLSAVTVLGRLPDAADAQGVQLLWSQVDPATAHELGLRSVSERPSEMNHEDLDHAIEQAENLVLNAAGADRAQITDLGLSDDLRRRLVRRTYTDGELIEAYGSMSRRLYLIQHGRCEVTLPNGSTGRLRLREFGTGTVFGEIGFHFGEPRTADITAVGEVTVLTLDRADYETLCVDEPQIALELSELMLGVNFRRVADLNRRLDRALA